MNSNKVFQIALLVSVIAHGIILFQNPNLYNPQHKEKKQQLEVSYVKPPQETKRPERSGKLPKGEPFLNIPPKISLDKRIPPPFIDKGNILKRDKIMPMRNLDFAKPSAARLDILAIKKKITLPPIEMNKINNPSYISYYQIVREKIKRAAYQNYTGRETGEITISFVISSDGILKDLRLLEERSSASEYLREIALRSVKDASPFPNFPKELDYPRLSFNLAITFEIE
ncbi:MAG: TonB family protein [Candidatus Omnitrophota bacterium]